MMTPDAQGMTVGEKAHADEYEWAEWTAYDDVTGTYYGIPYRREWRRPKLFISHAHEDVESRLALEKHLSSLVREGLVTTWSDETMLPGADWEHAIRKALDSANIVVFLVSPDLMASGYVWDVELPRALDRESEGDAIVVPVIVRAVDWTHSVLGSHQAVPREGRPVSEWLDQDEAWVDVVSGIRRLVEQTRKRVEVTSP